MLKLADISAFESLQSTTNSSALSVFNNLDYQEVVKRLALHMNDVICKKPRELLEMFPLLFTHAVSQSFIAQTPTPNSIQELDQIIAKDKKIVSDSARLNIKKLCVDCLGRVYPEFDPYIDYLVDTAFSTLYEIYMPVCLDEIHAKEIGVYDTIQSIYDAVLRGALHR